MLTALREQGLSIPDFCARDSLSRLMVEQILRGQARRISLDQAIDLKNAANRHLRLKLVVEDFSLRTAGDVEPRGRVRAEKRRPPARPGDTPKRAARAAENTP